MVSKGKCGSRTDCLGSTAIAAVLMIALSGPAHALSELKPVQVPATNVEQGPSLPPLDEPTIGPDGGLPLPDPIIRETPQSQSEDLSPDPAIVEDKAPADIITDLTLLPEPARRMRELILEAAATGDPEKLRALLGSGPNATQLAFSEIDTDSIEYLRSISGDGEGQEILAILIEFLPRRDLARWRVALFHGRRLICFALAGDHATAYLSISKPCRPIRSAAPCQP